jgi:hypothetical protein
MNFAITDLVIGPIVTRAEGYAFDSWAAGEGMRLGYPYRRIEDAHYARNATIRASSRDGARGAVNCRTVDEFAVRSAVYALPAAA